MSELQVLQLSRYSRLGGSSRLRFYDFHPALKAHGIEVRARPFFEDEYLKRLYSGRRVSLPRLASYYAKRFQALAKSRECDLIWLEKEALPWLPAFLESGAMRHIPYVIDFDDAWFHRYDRHRNPLIRTLLSRKFPSLVRDAAAVIAGSPYLEQWARDHGARKIVRIPTTVDLDRYKVKPAREHARFVIGWMGSPSSAAYLQLIDGALKDLADNSTGVRLVGSGPIPLSAPQVTIVPWTEHGEAEELAGFDVGIMPLTADSWSEGKCAYKLIQYMAAGLPTVASPVGMNRDVVRHGVTGFLAETPREWHDALNTLRRDPALRARMGAAGRADAEAKYSLMGNAGILAQTLSEAAGRGGNP